MIRIKDYILNENSIMQIDKCCDGLHIQVENGSIHIDKATFEDIEWNYGGAFEIMSEEEQLRQNGENNKDKILELRNDLIDKLQNKIKELEEENKTLKELNVCVGCDNNPDYKTRIKELEEENERLKAEVDLLNDNRHYLNNKIGKVIIFIKKNIELNNGALSNREELIVSKHDLIKNETDVLNYLINILKGEK